MRVVLTHEQADFDALGSLLGVYLLDPGSLPILPRKINRNARQFVNIYRNELPFIDGRDLPARPVKMITLADTQSLYTIKGLNEKTEIRVIDHHPLRRELPEEWKVTMNTYGACTTYFVEQLRANETQIGPFQATLLLLGIYEDTGSLTYPGTKPEDVYAAAYLLEKGANLTIAASYLNPPLSPDQLKAYDRLLSVIENHELAGNQVMTAAADLTGMSDEISSVAHKLRDLLEPDALILIVKTDEGIRLVLRSTTDRINVAGLASHFGGGGHQKAAGALINAEKLEEIEGDTLERIRREVLTELPRHVMPPLTVEQIMSSRPLVLSPQTSAKDALTLMQRYGYEGYPVVEDGRVVGLLNRRAVDRAIAHKLDMNASSLMEAGQVTVRLGDSIQEVQRVMSNTGWGQVPVVHPETNAIIGIVTRTDLLKTLSGQNLFGPRRNLSDRLESALSPGRLALLKAVAGQAFEMRMAVYIVGGFVRDLILDRPSLDFDIVVEGDAIELGRALVRQFEGRITSHSRFRTAKWQIKDIRQKLAAEFRRFLPLAKQEQQIDPIDLPESLDLISARTEFYDYPTALPTVERSSIKLDLHRRDFTINTMALRLDGPHYGELYDYWGGLPDLQQKQVRVLHSLSFVDDPTRMLRAVRFEQRFGFRIEPRTLQLMSQAYPLLKQVSGQRLRHEFDLILQEPRGPEMLARLDKLDLLTTIHTDLDWQPALAEPLRAAITQSIPELWEIHEQAGSAPAQLVCAYTVWLAHLRREQLESTAECLKFSGVLKSTIAAGSRVWRMAQELPGYSPSEVVTALEPAPLLALYAVNLLPISDQARQQIINYVERWRFVSPTTDGNTLQALGLPRGPVYREILESLRRDRLDGRIQSDRDEQIALEKMLEQLGVSQNR